MAVRHVVFAAEKSGPRCPLKVVRVSADGIEETFTRDLVWQPSSTLGDELPANAWEVGPRYATTFLADMVVEMRTAKHVRPHADGFLYRALFHERADVLDLDACHGLARLAPDGNWSVLTGDGTWEEVRGLPAERSWGLGGPAAVAVGADEAARLVARGVRLPERFEWHVIWDENDAIPAGVVRVRADGTEEVFTRDLVWERSDLRHRTTIRVRPAPPPEARRAMDEMVRLMMLLRRKDWDNTYQYYGIFSCERDSVDLTSAYKIVRHPRENRWEAEEWTFATKDGWTRTDVLHHIDVGRSNSEAVPITPAECDELVAMHLDRTSQWRRAYGN